MQSRPMFIRAATPAVTARNACLGFSLVELLLALAVGASLLFALWEVHAATARSQAYRQMLIDLTAQGHVLQYMWQSRLVQAGFWGYRHIDQAYSVTNLVCPQLMGHRLSAVQVLTQADGQHVQISYLDAQATIVEQLLSDNVLDVARTTLFAPDEVVGVGDLHQGWVNKVTKVNQRGQVTQLVLAMPLPALTLPAMIGEFHGVDDSVSKTTSRTLGLWEQPCDAKRGLILDKIHAWDVGVHIRGGQDFTRAPLADAVIDGLRIDILLTSEQPLLTAPMRYRWQNQTQLGSDKRYYLPWHIVANLAQEQPLGG